MTEQQADAPRELPDVTGEDLPEQMRIRSEKRARILAAGKAPYPIEVGRTHTLAEVRAAHAELETGASSGDIVTVAGRVVRFRDAGKLLFAVLQDGDGTQLQVMVSKNGVGDEALASFKADVDLADFVSVHGEVISSRRGELSVMADSWAMASKALRPLPVLHKDMSEEARVRQRYVDLIVRPAAREVVKTRAGVVRSLRDTFHARDFTEVETPMLQVQHGGAAARPFQTHMNAFDIDLFLRIAPELFLKRAVVGGIDRVFEINRNFRNEGADSTHSPEFAMIEAYQAYGDYNSIADLARELVQNAARAVTGGTSVELADGTAYDLGGEWRQITMFGSLSEAAGREVSAQTEWAELVELAGKHDVHVQDYYGPGKLAEELFEALVVPDLYAPTFVRDYPEDTSPLVAAHRTTPGVTEKWDLYVRSFELGTGYSELVDPVVQRERFVAQARAAAAGDDEAMKLDEDFLRAMEHGMPPTGGLGMGLDRLLMAITGLGIRETILFPLVKPE
ncbi:lysine--tRNA ligase [Kineosporia succinea]|uniref:Lysine--tRNA ligase n=1 Tax=Kineosporia succinea TaxID=84632 RepID=A0ABT9P3A8_9ACTN|nr:lysine--tRNA ligase [Kineosporia succinea]MDP9827056.1 lysyl-tRNA synthetase class 2 [Kineosporia succinea]